MSALAGTARAKNAPRDVTEKKARSVDPAVLDLATVEQALAARFRIAVEQARVDANPAVAHPRLILGCPPDTLRVSLPVRVASALRAMVERDHPVAPDVRYRLAADPDLPVVGIISHQRATPPAEAAIAPPEPFGRARHLDRDGATVAGTSDHAAEDRRGVSAGKAPSPVPRRNNRNDRDSGPFQQPWTTRQSNECAPGRNNCGGSPK